MSLPNFLPPDSLIEAIPLISTLNMTMNYVDYVQESPIPRLSTVGIDDIEIVGQIQTLQKAIDEDYPKVQKLAGIWITTTIHEVMSVFIGLSTFAHTRFGIYYKYINKYAISQDKESLNIILNKLIAEAYNEEASAKIALGALLNFKAELDLGNQALQKNYDETKQALSSLSDYTTQMENKIKQLRNTVDANNKKVAQTATDETGDLVQNGVGLATDAATDNGADAIKTGATLSFNAAKAGIDIIVMDQETISLLHDINKLAKKLNKVENDLQILNNASSQLSSLLSTHFFSKSAITSIEAYWQDLQTYLQAILSNLNRDKDAPIFPDTPNPQITITTWLESIYRPINTYLGFDSTPAEWNIDTVKMDSLDNLDQYKS